MKERFSGDPSQRSRDAIHYGLFTAMEDRRRSSINKRTEIVLGIARGLTNAEIAEELGLSPDTIKNSVSALFPLLDVRSRTGLYEKVREWEGFEEEAFPPRQVANILLLTPTERTIAVELGNANKGIAESTSKTIQTVKNHVTSILKKTGARNRVDALRTYYSARDDYGICIEDSEKDTGKSKEFVWRNPNRRDSPVRYEDLEIRIGDASAENVQKAINRAFREGEGMDSEMRNVFNFLVAVYNVPSHQRKIFYTFLQLGRVTHIPQGQAQSQDSTTT